MALIENSDFSQKNQVDMASIASLYQRKAEAEQQMKMQQEQITASKQDRMMQVMGLASKLTSTLVDQSVKKQQLNAQNALMATLSTPGSQEAKIQAQTLAAFPKEAGEELAKSAFAKPTQEDMGRPQQGSIELSDGKIIPATFKQGKYFYPNTETPIPAEKIVGRGYGLVPVTNADGSVSMVSRVTAKEAGVVNTGAASISPEKYGTVSDLNSPLLQKTDRADIIKELHKVKSDPAVKNAVKMIPMLDNVEKYLKVDNKVAMDRLGGLTQKMIALDSGNLAAWEQRDPGSREYIERLKQYASMSTKGTLSPKNKEGLIEVLTITRENLKANVEASAGMSIDSLVEMYPQLNKDAMYKKAGLSTVLKYVGTKNSAEEEANAFFSGLGGN